ncbi:MAG TPA: hypothetical protein G4N98_02110 [Thermoflexia bacterium]|nr:hypothetical protein [Thermoflexia bacterium]
MNYQQSPTSYDSSDTIAMVIEIVFGIFGMLGMGWIYVGNYIMGIGLFVGWLVVLFVGMLIPTIFTTFTAGLGGFSYCCLPPLSIVGAIISGLRLRDYVRNTRAQGNIAHLIIAIIVALLLLCLAIAIPLFALGGFAIISESMGSY